LLDNISDAPAPSAQSRTAREWLEVLAAYREPSLARSLGEIALTFLPLAAFWLLAWAALSVSYALTLVLALPAAFFLVRVFLIQHDCGHGTFFKSKAGNDWLGRFLGVLTLTPYFVWRRAHAIHHSSSGNLDKRGMGDIDTLTISEYCARSPLGRFAYRIYRHPIVLFGIGPSYLFLLQNRVPTGFYTSGWRYWLSAMGTNLGIAGFVIAMTWLVGLEAFLMVHLPIVMMAASIGVWLFYVQHQFEETSWDPTPTWNQHEAALLGSSYYEMPRPLRWLTANIGIHHVHHLYSRIPFYRLNQVLRDHPQLADVQRITLQESLACVKLKLWDDQKRKLVSFSEAGPAIRSALTAR
jgi:acyl-lipid omega-6 desaturase (Delta-12 desaturase)